jgi:hypothetical protein
MPISDAKKARIGAELINWLYLGIRAGARASVKEYRAYTARGDSAQAIEHLKRAVNMPRRMRERLNYDRQQRGLTVGQYTTAIAGCLTLAGSTITFAELNAELTTLEAQGAQLIADKTAGTKTLDQVADWIEANWQDEVTEWVFPFDPAYTDNW